MDNTIKQINCIQEFIRTLDYCLNNFIQMDNKMSYGLATRQHSYNGQIINVDTNPLIPTEGEVTFWDDRYSMIWFHRVNRVNIEETSNGRYGRLPSAVREQVDLDLVVWASVNYTWLGDLHTHTQFELYRKIMGILVYKTLAEVKSIEMDMPGIARQEFLEQKVHKETLLLKFNYQFCYNVPKDCYCVPPPIECKP